MKRPSPTIAAALSFLWPGAGHAYLGRRRTALVFAGPAVLVTLVLALASVGGLTRLAAYVVTPGGALTLLVLILLVGIWRVIALGDASMVAMRRSGSRSRVTLAIVGALAVATVGMHLFAAYGAYALYDASSRIFVAGGPDDAPSSGPVGSGLASPIDDDFFATPVATPESPDARINVLLTGVDSADGRDQALTDTLIVVSVNPADGSVAMISLPRDIARFRLSTGQVFNGKINSLSSYARNHPLEFPDGPLPTLIREVGWIVGVPIHYYAAIDIGGFRRMIDGVGGVTVQNERAISDPQYSWLDGTYGFYLPAGSVTLDGRTALAFVRSRRGSGDNDFTRAARQQVLLLALQEKLTSAAMLPQLPGLLDVAGDTMRTNLPQDRFVDFVELARQIQGSAAKRYVLGPPYSIHPPTDSTGGVYILMLDEARVAALSIDLFGDDSRYAAP